MEYYIREPGLSDIVATFLLKSKRNQSYTEPYKKSIVKENASSNKRTKVKMARKAAQKTRKNK